MIINTLKEVDAAGSAVAKDNQQVVRILNMYKMDLYKLIINNLKHSLSLIRKI